MLEAFSPAIVGVWYFTVFVPGAEFAEETHLGLVLPAGVRTQQSLPVLFVHDQHKVELRQILPGGLAGDVGEVQSTLGSRLDHACIGALALMPVLGACRVDVDTVMQACIQHHPAHHSFSSG